MINHQNQCISFIESVQFFYISSVDTVFSADNSWVSQNNCPLYCCFQGYFNSVSKPDISSSTPASWTVHCNIFFKTVNLINLLFMSAPISYKFIYIYIYILFLQNIPYNCIKQTHLYSFCFCNMRLISALLHMKFT